MHNIKLLKNILGNKQHILTFILCSESSSRIGGFTDCEQTKGRRGNWNWRNKSETHILLVYPNINGESLKWQLQVLQLYQQFRSTLGAQQHCIRRCEKIYTIQNQRASHQYLASPITNRRSKKNTDSMNATCRDSHISKLS